MHQKTKVSGSLQVSGHVLALGILKFLAAVFGSGNTPPFISLNHYFKSHQTPLDFATISDNAFV